MLLSYNNMRGLLLVGAPIMLREAPAYLLLLLRDRKCFVVCVVSRAATMCVLWSKQQH